MKFKQNNCQQTDKLSIFDKNQPAQDWNKSRRFSFTVERPGIIPKLSFPWHGPQLCCGSWCTPHDRNASTITIQKEPFVTDQIILEESNPSIQWKEKKMPNNYPNKRMLLSIIRNQLVEYLCFCNSDSPYGGACSTPCAEPRAGEQHSII